MSNVPMSFFPVSVSKKISAPLQGLGELVQVIFPKYNLVLKETDLNLMSDEFFAIAIFNSLIWFGILTIASTFVLTYTKFPEPLISGIIISTLVGIMFFFRIVFGVQLLVSKRVKSIDSNLVFGLKMMLVEINAGVGLFDSILIIASHKLGDLSSAFKEVAKRMSAGEREEDVLTDVASKNPSPFLKKIIWQIINGLKAGAPMGKIIEESLLSLERQQKTDIIEYGSSLRVLTLMFMMSGVIIPAMGLAFLSVLDSLPGIQITQEIFIGFIGLVVVLQFMLIGYIKSKRPNLMGSV
jgi:flagellar protein FlaJ